MTQWRQSHNTADRTGNKDGFHEDLIAADAAAHSQFSQVSGPSAEFREELKNRLVARAQTQRRAPKVVTVSTTWRWIGSAAAVVLLVGVMSLLPNNDPLRLPQREPSGDSGSVIETFQTENLTEAPDGSGMGVRTMMAAGNENESGKTAANLDTSPGTGVSEADAGVIAQAQVNYPAKVMGIAKVEVDGRVYWRVSLTRDGMGIPNRDDVLVDCQTGEPTLEMSAQ